MAAPTPAIMHVSIVSVAHRATFIIRSEFDFVVVIET